MVRTLETSVAFGVNFLLPAQLGRCFLFNFWNESFSCHSLRLKSRIYTTIDSLTYLRFERIIIQKTPFSDDIVAEFINERALCEPWEECYPILVSILLVIGARFVTNGEKSVVDATELQILQKIWVVNSHSSEAVQDFSDDAAIEVQIKFGEA